MLEETQKEEEIITETVESTPETVEIVTEAEIIAEEPVLSPEPEQEIAITPEVIADAASEGLEVPETITIPAEPVHNDRILEVYGTKGEVVKTFTIKDGEDYIEQGKIFANVHNHTIGIRIK
jgi:hypothetical protein